jgi:cytochrome c biogenesis protein CcdA
MLLLLILAYLGGVLTILSPCILPVLPFVFARADRPFARNGLPMRAGMALAFAAVATLAALGGGWAVHANQYGRIVALAVLAVLTVLGLTLLSNRVAEWITNPFVTLGNTLTGRSGAKAIPCSRRRAWAWPQGCCGRPAQAPSWARCSRGRP